MYKEIPSPHNNIIVPKRTLHFFWITDCSGSMAGNKIASLNAAIHESIGILQDTLKKLSIAAALDINMRAIKFSDTAEWHVGPAPVPFDQFIWPDLEAGGYTATSKALKMLIDELSVEKMPARGVPPIAILISDGLCTDPESEYQKVIEQINSDPWGMKCIRMAIAIGDESEYDESALTQFINPKTIPLLKAKTPAQLIEQIQWAPVASVSIEHMFP